MAKSNQKSQQAQHERGDLVLTPGGWRPKSKVIYVPPDQHVSGDGGKLKIVHTASGRIVKDLGAIPRVSAARSGARGAARMMRVKPAAKPHGAPPPAPITNGWIVNAEWTNTTGNPISYFSTKWIVPPAPATDNNQLVYLFNGIQQTSGGPFILQPVLQWGSSPAGGGKYWSITNWYVNGQGGTALFGNLVQVNSGDVLRGIMTLTAQSGAQFSYLSSFDGFSTADLNVTNIAELKWANQTLECYGFKAFTDYPDTALTPFYEIEIKVRTQTTPTIIDTDATLSWLDDNNVTDNGQKAVTVSNDSPGGDVYLYYRTVTQTLYFITDKSTFGRDEVHDVINASGGRFSKAFWVVLEGFTIDQLSIDHATPLAPVMSGQFKNFPGVTISPSAGGPEYELPGDTYTPQRIRFPFDIVFSSSALASFPNPGDAPEEEALQAAMTVSGTALAATTEFELVGGADPYFTNVDPNQGNVFYLSQDLRVFTAAPSINNTPVPGGPTFGADSVGGAYDYIQHLITHLNTNFWNPGGTDPFNSLLPGQSGALTGDSSVTPYSLKSFFPPVIATNYNFAVARVRLRGSAGPGGAANNVKVFFRMWGTQSADTDYQTGSTYLSNLDAKSLPASPLPAPDSHTIPFFATGNAPNFGDPGNAEYGTTGVNNRTVQIPSGDQAWAYFGCFLNIYDSSNVVNGAPVQAHLAGTHHCLVAQIAYDDAPIINAGGVTMSPENSDKLAQRNMQVTHSDNPGIQATHRVPQTFDARPSAAISATAGALLNYPDELMIDWGATPPGSTATIYWPQVNSADVLTLAARLYNTHQLSAPDTTTVQCTVNKGVTYVPIPSSAGGGQNFAGLLTIDLPQTVRTGQEFNVIVRRITTRQFGDIGVITREPAASNIHFMRNWRYVVGTFQVKIPVSTKEVILFPEENTLAILKWRLLQISPSNRWYPVLQRYISYVAARIDGLGGDSTSIQPSPTGVPVEGTVKDRRERSGKVCEVLFDCFGDFEGFVLCSCTDKYVFHSRERGIADIVLRACRDRLAVSVWETGGKIRQIAVRC